MTYVVGIAEPRRQFGMTALHHGAVHGGADVLRALLDGKYRDKSQAFVTYRTICGILKDTQCMYAVHKIEQPVQYQVQDVEQHRLFIIYQSSLANIYISIYMTTQQLGIFMYCIETSSEIQIIVLYSTIARNIYKCTLYNKVG